MSYQLTAGGAQYYTVHDGSIYVPDDKGTITTEDPAHAATLALLGCTPITPPPPDEATDDAPEDAPHRRTRRHAEEAR